MNARGQTAIVSFPIPIIMWVIVMAILGWFYPKGFSDNILINTIIVLGSALLCHAIFFGILWIWSKKKEDDKK